MSDIISVLVSNISTTVSRKLKVSGATVVRLFSADGVNYYSVTGTRGVVESLQGSTVLSPVSAQTVISAGTSGRPVGSKTARVPVNSPSSE